MHCEYCSTNIKDVPAAKKHMLTIAHIRNKRAYDLSTNLFIDRRRQAAIHPKSFEELAFQLNMHTYKDVNALDKSQFFDVKSENSSAITREMISLLNRSVESYHYNQLPAELREPLARLLKNQMTGESES